MNCNAPILDDEKPTPWHTPLEFMGVDLMDYVQRKKELNGPGDSVDRNIKKEHRIGPDHYFSDDGETRGRLFADIKKILNEQGSNVFQEWDKKKKMLPPQAIPDDKKQKLLQSPSDKKQQLLKSPSD